MAVRFFNPSKDYKKYKKEIDSEIKRVLEAGDLILRADGEKFEQDFARFVGTKYAVGLNSGTDALYLSLWALGIKAGDEVLVPSHTFVATAQVVAQLGATPVLYENNTFEVTPKTKAIMVAHIAGEFGCDFKEFRNLGVPIIEDACQALGAVQDAKKAGSFGLTGCFSFYPAKILGCYGDGGALVTDNEIIYNEIKELRNHYKKDYSKWGINSRLDNIQAAILNVKLKYLPETLEKRAHYASIYQKKLKKYPLGLPKLEEGRVWQDYIIRTPWRDELYSFLKERGIETMKNEYAFPIPKLPNSLLYESQSLRLPCNEHLYLKEVYEVIDAIDEFFKK